MSENSVVDPQFWNQSTMASQIRLWCPTLLSSFFLKIIARAKWHHNSWCASTAVVDANGRLGPRPRRACRLPNACLLLESFFVFLSCQCFEVIYCPKPIRIFERYCFGTRPYEFLIFLCGSFTNISLFTCNEDMHVISDWKFLKRLVCALIWGCWSEVQYFQTKCLGVVETFFSVSMTSVDGLFCLPDGDTKNKSRFRCFFGVGDKIYPSCRVAPRILLADRESFLEAVNVKFFHQVYARIHKGSRRCAHAAENSLKAWSIFGKFFRFSFSRHLQRTANGILTVIVAAGRAKCNSLSLYRNPLPFHWFVQTPEIFETDTLIALSLTQRVVKIRAFFRTSRSNFLPRLDHWEGQWPLGTHKFNDSFCEHLPESVHCTTLFQTGRGWAGPETRRRTRTASSRPRRLPTSGSVARRTFAKCKCFGVWIAITLQEQYNK